MTDLKIKSEHEISLFYLFTLGGSLFTFGKCGALCLVFAAFLGALTLFLAMKLKNFENPIYLWALASLCILSGIYTFSKFVIFIKQKQLFYTSVMLIGILFAAVIFYFIFCRKKVLVKFSLLAFIITVAFFTLLFFTTVKNADFSKIKLSLSFDLKESLRVYFLLFFPSFIPAFWFGGNYKNAFLGQTGAGVTLLVFVVLTYCTFGKINTRLNSPILALVDTANVGRVFTRLDAFLLSIIYLSCLVRSGVSFKAAFEIFKIIAKKSKRFC